MTSITEQIVGRQVTPDRIKRISRQASEIIRRSERPMRYQAARNLQAVVFAMFPEIFQSRPEPVPAPSFVEATVATVAMTARAEADNNLLTALGQHASQTIGGTGEAIVGAAEQMIGDVEDSLRKAAEQQELTNA